MVDMDRKSPDELLTTAQVAELVGRSTATVSRWAQDGVLHPAAQANGRVFYRSDVENLLQRLHQADELVRRARNLRRAS